MKRLDTINLSSYMSMILPDMVVETQDKEKLKQLGLSTTSFGLFDASSPNYITFYPGMKKEDYTPENADFINPVFRLLSSSIIRRGDYDAIEFSEEVLKESMPLLVGLAVYPGHEMLTGNELGAVKEVFYQEATEVNGIRIPGGINGIFNIDAKSNPRIVRNLTMNPPAIHSNSVTVRFEWDKSHPKLSDSEFMKNLTKLVDGRMVTRLVKKVVAYLETSLVPHGADPFAKMIGKDGKILLPELASILGIAKFSAEEVRSKFFEIDYKTNSFNKVDTVSNTYFSNSNQNNDNKMNEKLIKFMALIGLSIADQAAFEALTEEQIQGALAAHVTKSTETLSTKITDLETQLTAEKQKVTDLEASNKSLTDKEIINLRAEAEKFYKLTVGETVDQNVIKLITEASSVESLTALLNQHKEAFESKVPLTCGKCGSTEVSRKTSLSQGSTTEDFKTKLLKEEYNIRTKNSPIFKQS